MPDDRAATDRRLANPGLPETAAKTRAVNSGFHSRRIIPVFRVSVNANVVRSTGGEFRVRGIDLSSLRLGNRSAPLTAADHAA
jgi:hypothetical protein